MKLDKLRQRLKGWITIGEGDEGGTHVYVDGSGKITAGPVNLTGQNIGSLSKPKEPDKPSKEDKPKKPSKTSHEEMSSAIQDVADRHIAHHGVGIAMHDLYSQVRQQHPDMSKEDLKKIVQQLHDEGRFRLGGWPRIFDELPDPELAVLVGGSGRDPKRPTSQAPSIDEGKLMWYLHPAPGFRDTGHYDNPELTSKPKPTLLPSTKKTLTLRDLFGKTWNESDHPRADDGKFGSGGNSGGDEYSARLGDLAFINYNDPDQEDNPLNKKVIDAIKEFDEVEVAEMNYSIAKQMTDAAIESSFQRNQEALQHLPNSQEFQAFLDRKRPKLEAAGEVCASKIQQSRDSDAAKEAHEDTKPAKPDSQEDQAWEEYQNAHSEWESTLHRLTRQAIRAESRADRAIEQFQAAMWAFNDAFADKIMDIMLPETAKARPSSVSKLRLSRAKEPTDGRLTLDILRKMLCR